MTTHLQLLLEMFGHAKATDDINGTYVSFIQTEFMTRSYRKAGLSGLRKDGIEILQTPQKQEIKNLIRARFENE